METALLLAIALAAISAAASFFFALAETAVFSLSPWQVRELATRAPAAGGRVARLLSRPEELLATLGLGNTLANAALLGISLWLALSGRWPLGVTVAGLLLLTVIGCEVLPKTLAVRKPGPWSLRVSRPLAAVHALAHPFHRVAQWLNARLLRVAERVAPRPPPTLTEAEYQELVELAYQQGTLAETERDLILQIISLDRRTVKDVMQPRSEMRCVSDDLSVEELVAAARQSRQRRLPILDEDTDTIVGILNTRAFLLDPNHDLAEATEFPSFVPETMNLLQLFLSLQRQGRGLAIVLDEFGGTAGLVTMEGILSVVIGPMRTEARPAGFVMEKLGPGRWRVNATMRLDDFRREYPALGDVPEVETLGGLLLSRLDHVPAPGESATFAGLKLTTLAADERRVRELLVEQLK